MAKQAYRNYRIGGRLPSLVNPKTGQINRETVDFIRPYARKWRQKSLYQILIFYRAARFQDLVNLCQQVHIYNQRIVAGLHKCTRTVPLDRLNTREVHSSQLGPMPVALRKLPLHLDQVPFYDTNYMIEAANSMLRQKNANLLSRTWEDEEAWDSPLERNPSVTSCLLTYNAFKKEQACQTNWDRMSESDIIYNQTFHRDPQIFKRSQMQINGYNSYNNYHDYTNQNSLYNKNFNQQSMNFIPRTASRRNSLKNHAAPPPPPFSNSSMEIQRSRQERLSNRSPSVQHRSYDAMPTDLVSELQNLIHNRGLDAENDSHTTPFNFRSMLRKTNYQPNERSIVYKQDAQQSTFQQPKLRPTGIRLEKKTDEHYKAYHNTSQETLLRKETPLQTVHRSFDDNNNTSFEETGNYVEEEIAPGVTISGYAVDI